MANNAGAQNFIDQLNAEFNQSDADNKKAEEKKKLEISEAELIHLIK